MKRIILFAAIAGLLVSCVRDIDVKEGQTEQGKDEVINQFDSRQFKMSIFPWITPLSMRRHQYCSVCTARIHLLVVRSQ